MADPIFSALATTVPSWPSVVDARVGLAGGESSFALDVSRFVEKAKGRADLVFRKIALDVLTRVVRRSPVDTGRFRNNWFTSVSQTAIMTTEAVDRSGQQAVARATAVVKEALAGQVIVMSNSLPYARRLEYGYSSQAPSGMVRVTVAEYQQIAARAAGAAQREIP